MSDLRDEVVFITGGGSGLGLALVERFIEEGAKVATLELSAAKVASLRQRFGEHVLAVEGNVTCYADYQRAVEQLLNAFGELDCFIGNAGIWDHNASLVNTPADSLESGFHELFNVNVLGYLLGAKACAPALIASQGSMIFTLSNAAWYPAAAARCIPPASMRRPDLSASWPTSWRRKFVLTVSVPAAWPPTCEGRRLWGKAIHPLCSR